MRTPRGDGKCCKTRHLLLHDVQVDSSLLSDQLTHAPFYVVHSYGWGTHDRALMTWGGVLMSNRCFYVLIIWSGLQVRQCHTPRERDIDTSH